MINLPYFEIGIAKKTAIKLLIIKRDIAIVINQSFQ